MSCYLNVGEYASLTILFLVGNYSGSIQIKFAPLLFIYFYLFIDLFLFYLFLFFYFYLFIFIIFYLFLSSVQKKRNVKYKEMRKQIQHTEAGE